MRLIAATSLELVEYSDERQIPRYGILSHRWQDEEVTYQDMLSRRSLRRKGYTKLKEFCRQCTFDGLTHAWMDTCCIDKNSSAELSEAINSMYRWYHNATKCYVFMSDVHAATGSSFTDSEWFQRSWTLQELIAPDNVHFYDVRWKVLGSKVELSKDIEAVTRIPQDVLHGEPSSNYSIAQRMSWAARRESTRIEDQAYSLMGLFSVNMPMLYGEGERAFIRLQEEIIKYSADQSIFAWPGVISNYDKSEMYDVTSRRLEGLLATSPAAFKLCSNLEWEQSDGQQQPFSITNLGLSIEVLLRPVSVEIYEAKLNCRTKSNFISIFVRQTKQDGQYVRHNFNGSLSSIWPGDYMYFAQRSRINVLQGHKAEMAEVCQPVFMLFPGPLSGKWSKTATWEAVVNSEQEADKTKIVLPATPHTATTSLRIKGGQDHTRYVFVEFGFDFEFDPYLFVRVDDKDSVVMASEVKERAESCIHSVRIGVLGRNVLLQKASQSPESGWMFHGHRSRGIFLWFSALNTVIDIQQKELLSQTIWMVDIQKADPRSPHLLSCASKAPKHGPMLNWVDVERETLTADDMCPICTDFLHTPIVTECRHTFCQSCFRWADVSVSSSQLAPLSTLAAYQIQHDSKWAKVILCPICGTMSESALDLDHQHEIQNKHPFCWRYATWRTPEIHPSQKFPALEFMALTIGNTHKLTKLTGRDDPLSPHNRHDWTFYVRPSQSDLIENVRIFLHPTFRPHTLDFSTPPYEIRRFGWGTFDIEVEVKLKSQYSFLHDKAFPEGSRPSHLHFSWTLSFSGDGDQGWIKLAVRRIKSKVSDHDSRLLAQYEKLRAFQAANEGVEVPLRTIDEGEDEEEKGATVRSLQAANEKAKLPLGAIVEDEEDDMVTD